MLTTNTSQRGTGLIEGLIAMLVLSIGLLGMAGLVLHVMRELGRSEYQSQAANAAQTVIGAAFAMTSSNPAALIKLNGVTTTQFGSVQGAMLQALQTWANDLQNSLPPGSVGSMQVNSMTGGTCTTPPCVLQVTTTWSDHNQPPVSYVISQVMGY